MNKKILSRNRNDYERLEQVVGCKWSVSVLEAVRQGVNRPGALERCIEGISTKVLSERLRKLTDYGLLKKESYAEIPPRTEYSLTHAGKALVEIIAQIRDLDERLEASS
jgi:DNA-binding HxlR family transcriptional regulator